MIILYGAFTYRVSGSFTFNKPSIAWSIYETAHRDGWVTDTFAPTPTRELREVAQENSYSIFSRQPPTGTSPESLSPWQRSDTSGITLAGYLSQLLTRCKRMWTYIETYPERWHSKRVWGQLIFHRVLVLLALVGIPLSLTVWHQSWILISLFAYVTVFFIPTIGLPRYAVPAMPFVIILAAYSLGTIAEMLKCNVKQLTSSSKHCTFNYHSHNSRHALLLGCSEPFSTISTSSPCPRLYHYHCSEEPYRLSR